MEFNASQWLDKLYENSMKTHRHTVTFNKLTPEMIESVNTQLEKEDYPPLKDGIDSLRITMTYEPSDGKIIINDPVKVEELEGTEVVNTRTYYNNKTECGCILDGLSDVIGEEKVNDFIRHSLEKSWRRIE